MPEESDDGLAVTVNGESRAVSRGTTVGSLLAELDQHPQTVAVEHNGSILARRDYDSASLREGDRVEIVRFVQGGLERCC